MKQNINITEQDYISLCELLKTEKVSHTTEKGNLDYLGGEIKRAKRVKGKRIKTDFVRMNSFAEVVDLDTNREMKVRLVFPKDADFKTGKISVLSMFGSALLGYKVGSTITFNAPRGVKKIKIKNIIYTEEEH
ncbi:regulator of nucleoside diphosphate kinase [Mariniphaga anaerophila]|uniref:Regulator of nucleoside diphosphate kinase n=1 Tax=Mariniphaga anaerophila TaxID=1484053 RepID=A0A1M4YK21_9BACT|nr:GreA/GreB family elongation factor [Mariniphaga anaerophila]SHF06154.1 regulator of nucleoside diphosphate kinase [Mariniphaga anaerophila]